MNAATLGRTAGLILTLSLSLPAQAIDRPAAAWQTELDSCLGALRVDLQDAETTRLRHTITDMEKRGAWYEFDIRSEVFADTGTREVESRCRAHRWTGDTEISS